MTEENPEKPQLRDCTMKAVRKVNASNGAPYVQMTAGSHRASGREKEGKDGGY